MQSIFHISRIRTHKPMPHSELIFFNQKRRHQHQSPHALLLLSLNILSWLLVSVYNCDGHGESSRSKTVPTKVLPIFFFRFTARRENAKVKKFLFFNNAIQLARSALYGGPFEVAVAVLLLTLPQESPGSERCCLLAFCCRCF